MTSSSEDKRRQEKSALRMLRSQFGKAFIMPSPAQLPTCVAVRSEIALKSRADQKFDSLTALACSYALFVLIEHSPNAHTYYTALRKHHGISRKDGDPIMLLVRSVREFSPQTPSEAERMTQSCSEWSTAIRYCARKGIEPHKVVSKGLAPGQGVTAWAKKQRALRRKFNSSQSLDSEHAFRGPPSKKNLSLR